VGWVVGEETGKKTPLENLFAGNLRETGAPISERGMRGGPKPDAGPAGGKSQRSLQPPHGGRLNPTKPPRGSFKKIK